MREEQWTVLTITNKNIGLKIINFRSYIVYLMHVCTSIVLEEYKIIGKGYRNFLETIDFQNNLPRPGNFNSGRQLQFPLE